ncbi:MAG: phage terminase large subunit [Rhodospirillales bacterium]|nr:phage terminase large subunit [Rhodospirillales bacterium]
MTLLQWTRQVLRERQLAPAPHHRLLLAALADLARRRCDRLLVAMPPGSAKSTYASVLFPAWFLRQRPRARIIAACHTEQLAAHFGRQVRALLAAETDPGEAAIARDARSATRFATAAGGGYFGVGVRGPLAGRRADLIVIDDPIKSWAEADSETARAALWDWFRADLTTRLTPGGRIALVMTRWHEDDLAGRVLAAEDNWRTLILPALAEDADDKLGRAPGAPLWPAQEDLTALRRRRTVLGPRAWAALYQQRPRSDVESLFATGRIAVLEEAPSCRRVVRAWDLAATAAGASRDPDWTVGVRLGRLESGGVIVLDVVRLRAGPAEVAQAIVQTAQLDGRGVVVGLPQDPGQAGKQQVAWLSGQLTGFRVAASPETGAKLTRAGPVAACVEAGQLALLRGAWNRAFLDELRDFPGGRKDDQVDALARGFALLAQAPARRLELAFMGR